MTGTDQPAPDPVEPPVDAPPSTRPPRSVRWPYSRAVLFGIVLATLPFHWTETTSCQANAPPPQLKTGWYILFHDPAAAPEIVLLVAIALTTLWLAPRLGPKLRIVAHLVSTLASGTLAALVQFAATFTIGDHIRLLVAGYVALSALVVSVVDGLLRTILSVLEAWWARQDRRRQRSPDQGA